MLNLFVIKMSKFLYQLAQPTIDNSVDIWILTIHLIFFIIVINYTLEKDAPNVPKYTNSYYLKDIIQNIIENTIISTQHTS